MADESMVRNLRAQAEAIWPQERVLFERYALPQDARILDVGCGTGEIASRLAALFPAARVLGVDIIEQHLQLARERYSHLAPRLEFRPGDAFALELPDATFDLTVCRHMLQAVPAADRVIAELARVTRPGGRLHLLAEDYGMLHMPPGEHDPDRLWHEGVIRYTCNTGTDARNGRSVHRILRSLGIGDISVDFILVDTLRVPRETFASIMEAWRDGYTPAIAEHSDLEQAEILASFEQIIASIRDPDEYSVWHVPVVTGVVPDVVGTS